LQILPVSVYRETGMNRLVPRLTIALLLLLACAGMIAQAGSVPHTHKAHEPGLYNEEHDRSLLAALAAQALLSEGATAPSLEVVVGAPLPLVPERPALRTAHPDASRAPPTA
jgi:hypothetical protein